MSSTGRKVNVGAGPSLVYFLVAISGFSFWFLIAAPFASHRESYMWLAMVLREPFANALGVISTTWRPLAQVTTWLGFMALDPRIFPTSVVRQAILQGLVYLFFVLAWRIVYSASRQQRCFAIIALVAGGVFFPAYIHLFHIYGLFYVPVVLTLAVMLRFQMHGGSERAYTILAAAGIILAFWHPFAAVLFLAFYFGRYVATFTKLVRWKHAKAWAILILGSITVLTLLALSPRPHQPLNPFGFLVSYRTNEVNFLSSIVAWLLAVITVMGTPILARQKLKAFAVVVGLGGAFLGFNIPVLLLWILAALFKLICMRNWALVIPLIVATLLPYGGGLGGPVYGLFAMILAVFVTPLGWSQTEAKLGSLGERYATAFLAASIVLVLGLRGGTPIPVISAVAKPLFIERERTYQLEQTLSWLASSDYCAFGIQFTERAGDPIDDVESALTRQNRPPTTITDVGMFWDNVLRCKRDQNVVNAGSDKIMTLTFGVSELANNRSIFELPGSTAGPLKVWIREP